MSSRVRKGRVAKKKSSTPVPKAATAATNAAPKPYKFKATTKTRRILPVSKAPNTFPFLQDPDREPNDSKTITSIFHAAAETGTSDDLTAIFTALTNTDPSTKLTPLNRRNLEIALRSQDPIFYDPSSPLGQTLESHNITQPRITVSAPRNRLGPRELNISTSLTKYDHFYELTTLSPLATSDSQAPLATYDPTFFDKNLHKQNKDSPPQDRVLDCISAHPLHVFFTGTIVRSESLFLPDDAPGSGACLVTVQPTGWHPSADISERDTAKKREPWLTMGSGIHETEAPYHPVHEGVWVFAALYETQMKDVRAITWGPIYKDSKVWQKAKRGIRFEIRGLVEKMKGDEGRWRVILDWKVKHWEREDAVCLEGVEVKIADGVEVEDLVDGELCFLKGLVPVPEAEEMKRIQDAVFEVYEWERSESVELEGCACAGN